MAGAACYCANLTEKFLNLELLVEADDMVQISIGRQAGCTTNLHTQVKFWASTISEMGTKAK